MKNMIEERKKARGQGGFTLIELLVVIAILGILAGVVVFAVGNLTGDAKDSACEIELRTLETAVEAARASTLPTDLHTAFLKAGDTPTYWSVSGAANAEVITNVPAQNTGTPATGCVIP